jgi:hypothetical protein
LLALAAGCGRHINPAWCAAHDNVEPACQHLADDPDDTCDDCPGNVCLPEGGCADPRAVLYASRSGGGTACTAAAPCSLVGALARVTDEHNLILPEPDTYLGSLTLDRSVRILAPNVTLEADPATAATITIANGASVEIVGATIRGAVSASGVLCTTGRVALRGVKITGNDQGVTSGCDLTLERSQVEGNPNGALAISGGALDIRNNVIVKNGAKRLSDLANVTIGPAATGTFAFNTVAYNDAKANANPGVDCQSTSVTGVANLVADNKRNGMFKGEQIAGACKLSSSYAPIGETNLHWVSVDASDFHLTRESTAVIDAAPVECDGLDDIDRDTRHKGLGCDYGADEFVP